MKVLVVYATKYGCTEKAADLLKQELIDQGRIEFQRFVQPNGDGEEVEVTVVNISREPCPALSAYDTVVLGGAIYFGKLPHALIHYMKREEQLLVEKKLGLFICAGLPDPVIREQELRSSFPSSLMDRAVCADILGDEVSYQRLSWRDKLLFRAVTGSKSDQGQVLAGRIKQFAHELVASSHDGK